MMQRTAVTRTSLAPAVQIVIALAAAAALWALADVVLMLFLALVLACVLRGAADWVAARSGLGGGAALGVITLAILIAAAGAIYWTVPELTREGYDLVARVQQEWHVLQQRFGPLAHAGSGGGLFGLGGIGMRLASPLRMALGSSLAVLAGLVVVAVTALYLAATPELYVRGALQLIPCGHRPRVQAVMARIGHVLQLWVVGQLVDMLVVGVLSATGLMLVGVPAPLALGVLSGLLTFIPYFGAIIAAVPAVLVGFTIGWQTALWALAVYTMCHCVEGYVVAPLVQRRLVELPPALTVVAMTIAGSLFGVLGLMLGTPLAAAALVAVRMLYVGDMLGDRTSGGADRVAAASRLAN